MEFDKKRNCVVCMSLNTAENFARILKRLGFKEAVLLAQTKADIKIGGRMAASVDVAGISREILLQAFSQMGYKI